MRSSRELPEPGEALDWRALKTLVPYLLEFRARVGFALLCLVLAKLASVGQPFVLKYIVDDLDLGRESQLMAIPLALLLAYGSVRLANVLFSELRDTLFGRVTERAMRRVALKVFEHLHGLELAFHLERRTGALARDMERGTAGISFLMRFMVFNIVPTLLELGMVLTILLVNYSVGFVLITLASVVLYVIWTVYATERRTAYVRAMQMADNKTNTRAIDSLLNYETVKYFTNERYEAGHYDTNLAEWEVARRKHRLTLFALNGGQATIVSIGITAMLTLAAYKVSRGEITLGDFVLINAFMLQLFMPLNFLGFVYREIKGSLVSIERMFGLLKRSPSITDSPQAGELKVSQGLIQFDNVHFGYHPERPILRGVSFSVEPGQKVAVVGASGAGKSTIARLLFRFYDVDSGQILIDEQAISSVSQHSLRGALGIVPQDTVLFNDTIFENVRYGRPEASEQEVKQAVRMAHLSEFIDSLPEGYETVVGERGLKLSGGEKQRVAIARTILKRPPILVFDEATSALDSGSEQAILQSMREISAGHSSLVIAHRLSTVIDADNIVVLEQGQVAEQGTHSELLTQDGLYARMWQLQQEQDSETVA